jgi:EAL domain-containing protein (putative c-di-GMP-specific phosphodiesterase class I)
VKLDIGLVREIDRDAVRQALVAGIVYFARKSGCRLIAEGIETSGELDQLRLLGVELGRPAPAGQAAIAPTPTSGGLGARKARAADPGLRVPR